VGSFIFSNRGLKPREHPVIIALDNDEGLAAVASSATKRLGVAIALKSTADFYNIMENLYISKTPGNGSKNLCIEDMPPKKWRDHKINGMKLNTASKIDFSGFDPLLDRIEKAIQHQAAMASAISWSSPHGCRIKGTCSRLSHKNCRWSAQKLTVGRAP
jgi:hypothetical protein